VALLAAALNDPSRSQIGNPRTGPYHVSFMAADYDELSALEHALRASGVQSQTNPAPARPFVAYVAVYKREDRRRLYEVVEAKLEPERRKRLDDLIRAFGPIPPELRERMRATIAVGKSYEYLAAKLNEQGIVDGMGGTPWTAKSVKKALAQQSGHAGKERAAA
jgi:hypothetical protein